MGRRPRFAFRLLRHNRLLLVGAFALVAAGLVGFALDTGLEVGQWPILIGLTATPVGAVLLRYLWLRNPRAVSVAGEITIDDEALMFDGRVLCMRQGIKNGLLVRSETGTVVRLEQSWPLGEIELATDDEASARELLAGLELDGNRTTFRLASPTHQVVWARVLMYAALPAFFMTAAFIGVAALTWVVLFVVLAVLSRIPGWAVVGSDGITTSWLNRRKFIGHGEIRRVVRYGSGDAQGVQLVWRDGTSMKLPSPSMFTSEITDAATDRLLQQVERARKAHRPRRRRFVEVLEQSPEEPAEWVRDLRAAGSGGRTDHRTSALRPDDLWRVVEDPHAAPRARGGAAIALSTQLDPEGQKRLRIAAKGTASDEVRRALEAAAEDDATEEALIAAAGPLLERASR